MNDRADTGPSAGPAAEPSPQSSAAPLRLGFARGIAPGKWARRWEGAGGSPLELVPLPLAFGPGADPGAVDVLLERTMPGDSPAGSQGADRVRHALRLYAESVALVVPADHELAEAERVDPADLALVRLLDHPGHSSAWPAPESWDDPGWRPESPEAALQLVATGAGAILLPLPLARHLAGKREHAIVPVVASSGEELPRSAVWATWSVDRDAADVQQLAGIMRGRTARSSRGGEDPHTGGERGSARSAPQKPARKKQPQLKPGSRGAQLAAAREKAERAKAEKAKAKRRKRR